MAQVFQRRTNSIARAGIVLLLSLVCAGGWVVNDLYWSPWTTRQMRAMEQPVPFSHKHHVYGLGIDCRYCHTSVENSSFAGLPPTETCMTCHSQIWKSAPVLAPVRKSFTENKPLLWNRVHKTPDFVFFNHSIHIAKGVGCATCHGQLDQMPLTWESHVLYMKWCLDCHKNPQNYIRPREEVFNLTWIATNQTVLGPELVAKYQVHTEQLTDCSMCHR